MQLKVFPFFLVILFGCSEQVPEHLKKASVRPKEVNMDRVVDWSLKLNGNSFEGNIHVLKLDKKVEMVGHATPIEGSIPLGTNPDFVVSLRPKGEEEDQAWSALGVRNFHLEFKSPVIQGKAESSRKIKSEWFEAGDYDARLYYVIVDDMGGQTTVDLLATSTVSIVE